MRVLSNLTFLLIFLSINSKGLFAIDSAKPSYDKLKPILPLENPKTELEVDKKPETTNGGPKGGTKEDNKDKPDPVNGGPKGGLTSNEKDKPNMQNTPSTNEKEASKKVKYSDVMKDLLAVKKPDASNCKNIIKVDKEDFKVMSAEELLKFFNFISTCAGNGLVDTKQNSFKAVVDNMRLEIENRFKNPQLYEGENSTACQGIDQSVVTQVLDFIKKFLPINLSY
jgi:hypothetical protein